MKTLNELFEPDTHLGGSDGSRIFAPLNRLNISERERKRSLGWDKKRIAGRLSPFYRSVVMDPGPSLWQGNLIKHAILERHAQTSHARTHTHRIILSNLNKHKHTSVGLWGAAWGFGASVWHIWPSQISCQGLNAG